MEFPSTKDHCHGIMSRIFTMLSEPSLCDMRITVENNVFLAHRCVVVAACPNLYNTVMMEASENSVNTDLQFIFQGLSAAGFRSLLTYIYTGEPPDFNKKDMFAEFIKSCHVLGVELPENKMQDVICENINQDFIIEISTPAFDEEVQSNKESTVKNGDTTYGEKVQHDKESLELNRDAASIEEVQHNEESPVQNGDSCKILTSRIEKSIPVASSANGAQSFIHDLNQDNDIDCTFEYSDDENLLITTNDKKTIVPVDKVDISTLFSVKKRAAGDEMDIDTFCLRNTSKSKQGAGRPCLPNDGMFPQIPPFICPHKSCNKEFESRNILKKHYRNHEEKRNACDICPSKFLYKKDLIIHRRIHTGEKPYKCSECAASFTQKSTLKNHLVTHSKGMVPEFPCNICEKKYATHRSLTFHIKDKHSGIVLRYDCKGCGEKFKKRGAMLSHMRKQCNGSAFLCSKCGRKYKRKEPYQAHIKKCDADAVYKCAKCDLTFPTKKERYSHMVSYHLVNREKKDLVAVAMSAAGDINSNVSQNVTVNENSDDMELENIMFEIE